MNKKTFLTVSLILTSLFIKAQCQADFSFTQNGLTANFTDLSRINQNWSSNYSVTWIWDFGDGNTSSLQNPVHLYNLNGLFTPCLTVTYYDSTNVNWCTSVFCDSILIGNSVPISWDCNASGCYDPGTGLGRYSSFLICDSVCSSSRSSWNCSNNIPGGCYDPGNGTGQYNSLAACLSVCGSPVSSWDCGPSGCYDPGTGTGQYTSLLSCQAFCNRAVSNPCDSMTLFSAGGSQQTILIAEVPSNILNVVYWITTANDGTILGEDSISNSHQIFNNMNNGQPYDTINICISYIDSLRNQNCCESWYWNSNSGVWSKKINSTTFTNRIVNSDKKILKVIDFLGRETSLNKNQILFIIYEDGFIQKTKVIE